MTMDAGTVASAVAINCRLNGKVASDLSGARTEPISGEVEIIRLELLIERAWHAASRRTGR
jgi:hypothetical protein